MNASPPPHVCITGALGFVGRRLADRCCAEGAPTGPVLGSDEVGSGVDGTHSRAG